jgi:hypothetical protein
LISTFEDETKGDDGDESEHEAIFKVFIEKPDPTEVKLSKKNCCMVTIVQGEASAIYKEENHKLL